jgi:hypothetical protein
VKDGRIVVPADAELRDTIMHECHAPQYSGHVGVGRTLAAVRRTFWWKSQRRDVTAHVRKCFSCQVNKPTNQPEAGLAQSSELPSRCWECVSTDLIIHLPRTRRGHDAILVFVDTLSKMVHIAPACTSITAEQWATEFFRHVVRLHGLPLKLISDRGSQFKGNFTRELTRLLGTRQALSTAFHPRTDGQTERTNRTLEDMLRAYVSPAHDDWDDLLDSAEFAINNAWQASIQNTPFFVNYGQHPLTPLTADVESAVPSAARFVRQRQETLERAKECLMRAQDRQREQTNRKRREVSYAVGQEVLLSTRNIELKAPGAEKLMPKWIGPFPITQLVGPVAVKLTLPPHMQVHNVFHVNLVKPYVPDGTKPPPPPPLWIETDGSPTFKVECILDHRPDKRKGQTGRMQYLLRWQGFGPEHDTWEPEANILDKGLISAYCQAHGVTRAALNHLPSKLRKSNRVLRANPRVLALFLSGQLDLRAVTPGPFPHSGLAGTQGFRGGGV